MTGPYHSELGDVGHEEVPDEEVGQHRQKAECHADDGDGQDPFVGRSPRDESLLRVDGGQADGREDRERHPRRKALGVLVVYPFHKKKAP